MIFAIFFKSILSFTLTTLQKLIGQIIPFKEGCSRTVASRQDLMLVITYLSNGKIKSSSEGKMSFSSMRFRLICNLQVCYLDQKSRFDILKIHSRKMNLMRGIDLKKIAEKMNGASGAELKAVCTEAGMFALRERRVHVTQEDFEMAVAKVMKKETEKNMSLRKLWK